MHLLGYRSKLKRDLEMPSSVYMNLATWHTINQVYTRQTWTDLQELYLVTQARRMEGDLFGSIGAGLAVEAQRRFG